MGELVSVPPLFLQEMVEHQDKQEPSGVRPCALRMRRYTSESDASIDLVVDVFPVLD
jgi:hypothetical protein